MRREEARCPRCGTWTEVTDENPAAPFAVWAFLGGPECPACGYLPLFETECDFRDGGDHVSGD